MTTETSEKDMVEIWCHQYGVLITPPDAVPPRCDAQPVTISDAELAGWARNWHWNDCAEDKPVDPSIYFRDMRMLKAFIEKCRALSETKPAQGDARSEEGDETTVNVFRYLSPEPMPRIPEGTSMPLDLRTANEIVAERKAARSEEITDEQLAISGLNKDWNRLYNALRDIISIAKDANATDALGDIVNRAEEELGK